MLIIKLKVSTGTPECKILYCFPIHTPEYNKIFRFPIGARVSIETVGFSLWVTLGFNLGFSLGLGLQFSLGSL